MAREIAADVMNVEWQDYMDETSSGNDKYVFSWWKMSHTWQSMTDVE